MTAYGVFGGRKPGVYITWNECNEQVSCFPVACFKKYNCYGQAFWMRTTPTVSEDSEKVAGV
jgi:viroplasmin and RNaseH domain-containing protein